MWKPKQTWISEKQAYTSREQRDSCRRWRSGVEEMSGLCAWIFFVCLSKLVQNFSINNKWSGHIHHASRQARHAAKTHRPMGTPVWHAAWHGWWRCSGSTWFPGSACRRPCLRFALPGRLYRNQSVLTFTRAGTKEIKKPNILIWTLVIFW